MSFYPASLSGKVRPMVIPLVLTLVLVVVVGGPVWLVLTISVEPISAAHRPQLGLPSQIQLFQNYGAVFDEGQAINGFINSCLVTVPAIVLLLFFGSMAAWVFGRAKGRFLRALYYGSISGVLLPAAVITTVRVLQALGIYGTRPGLILFYAGASMSLTIFIMTGFVKSIPVELEEAAIIDGASTFRIFLTIVFPLLRPVLLTTMIILLLAIWNDFYWAFFLLEGVDQQTLPLGLYRFVSSNQYQLNYNLIFADIVVVSAPLLVVYVLAQKWIVAGLMGGAVK